MSLTIPSVWLFLWNSHTSQDSKLWNFAKWFVQKIYKLRPHFHWEHRISQNVLKDLTVKLGGKKMCPKGVAFKTWDAYLKVLSYV